MRIYATLAKRYGYTPNQIAEMTPFQQLAMYDPDEAADTLVFATDDEYRRWLTSQQ